MNKPKTKYAFKVFAELLPLLSFIVVFELKGFLLATYVMITIAITATIALFLLEKKIPLFSLLVTLITAVFAGISIFLDDPKIFILRDTFYDLFFGSLLAYGIVWRRNILKKFFGHMIETTQKSWDRLAIIWCSYFLVVAIGNEYIRQNEGLQTWVAYKLVVVCITCAVIALSLGITRRISQK